MTADVRSRSAARERSGDAPDAHGTGYLTEFRLEAGLPVWRYDIEGLVVEKRIFLPHMQNTVHVMMRARLRRRDAWSSRCARR